LWSFKAGRKTRSDLTHPKLWQLNVSDNLLSKKMHRRPPNSSFDALESLPTNYVNYEAKYGSLDVGKSRIATRK
jgi:hypothetical protein